MTRSFKGKQFKMREHLERLYRSIKIVKIPLVTGGAKEIDKVFLASDSASYITGEAIAINGGLRMD